MRMDVMHYAEAKLKNDPGQGMQKICCSTVEWSIMQCFETKECRALDSYIHFTATTGWRPRRISKHWEGKAREGQKLLEHSYN